MEFMVDKEKAEIKVIREFTAPLQTVWDAWTKSEILDQWWAPKPWKAKTKSMDFRVGGRWLYSMVGPDGSEQFCLLDYHAISPLKSYSGRDAFCDEHENISGEFPGSTWYVSFAENGNLTTVSITIQHNSPEDLEKIISMGFKEGFTMGMQNLDDLLAGKN
jgi:uncharacterized protein YndB with AHSA1/START domain